MVTKRKIMLFMLLFISIAGNVVSQYRPNSITEFFNMSDSLCLLLNDEHKLFLIFFKKNIIPSKKVKPIHLTNTDVKYTFNVDVFDLANCPETYYFSKGTIKRIGSKITCYDPLFKRYYTFNQTDKYTLVATKHTALFNKGDTLKMYSLWMNAGGYLERMSWKGNKKDGIWESSEWFGDSIRFVEYRDDSLIHRYAKARYIFMNLEDTVINMREIEVFPEPGIQFPQPKPLEVPFPVKLKKKKKKRRE